MLDAATGVERWRADHAGEVGRFTMNEEDLFVGIGENVACLRRTSGALKWAQPTGQLVTGRPAADARHVYAGGVDSFVYALRAHDGHVRWRFRTGGPVEANLVLASGVVYAGSQDHKVYALDTAEGEKIWALDVGAPVVALTLVGNLLIASTHAALVAVDARTGVASWTTESQDVVDGAEPRGRRAGRDRHGPQAHGRQFSGWDRAVAPRRGVVQRGAGRGRERRGGRVARQARPAVGVGCAGPPLRIRGREARDPGGGARGSGRRGRGGGV